MSSRSSSAPAEGAVSLDALLDDLDRLARVADALAAEIDRLLDRDEGQRPTE